MDLKKDKPDRSVARLRIEGAEPYVYDPIKPFNVQIRELISSTHPSQGPIIVTPFGKRFKVERDFEYWKNFSELTGTDGIGTKGLLHYRMRTENLGVQDAIAMVVDDLIESGHVPVMIQDHVMMQEEDTARILKIIKALTDLAHANPWQTTDGKSRPIILTGGETAILDTIQGFEVGITGTGYVKKGEEITANVRSGSVIIGLASNGVHSNGLSFYRKELFSKRDLDIESMLPWGVTIGEELTKTTFIYLPAIKALIEDASKSEYSNGKANSVIQGMVHITGGGLSKLTELLPQSKDLDIEIVRGHPLSPQEIFLYAHELGASSEDMYKRFNNGIGYAIAVEESYAQHALNLLNRYFKASEIGRVKEGTGKVHIESEYEPITVNY